MTDTTQPVCEFCEDTGWVSAPSGRGVVRCSCRDQFRRAYAEGVPIEFTDARLSTYRTLPGNKSARQAAETFLAEATGDLVLIGPVGTGKTRLACSILNDHYQATRTGLFIRIPKLLLDLQLTFAATRSAEDRLEDRQFLERLYGVSLLVLDDLGVEKPSDYSFRTLYTVYEERSDRGLRTIWTSNLGFAPDPRYAIDDPKRPQTLGEFLNDDRLPSRLVGRAAVAFLQCSDQRLPFNRRDRDD